MISPLQEHAEKLLLDHLAEWVIDLSNSGITAAQVKLLDTRCRKLVRTTNARYLRDLTASNVQAALADLRKTLSQQTVHFYLQAVKQFCRWLMKSRRIHESPVAHLSGGNVKTD